MLIGPIIGGKLIDNVCIAWQEDNCGDRGNCRLYNRLLSWIWNLILYLFNRWDFGVTLLGIHIVYKVLGLTCWVLAILTYKPDTRQTSKTHVEPENS